jgi:hypothetical protein
MRSQYPEVWQICSWHQACQWSKKASLSNALDRLRRYPKLLGTVDPGHRKRSPEIGRLRADSTSRDSPRIGTIAKWLGDSLQIDYNVRNGQEVITG